MKNRKKDNKPSPFHKIFYPISFLINHFPLSFSSGRGRPKVGRSLESTRRGIGVERGSGAEVKRPKLPFSKIDIKAGKMTFDQRIQLGKIFQEQGREFETLCKVFQCLHNYTPKVDDIKNLLPYYYEIIEGLTHWLQAESTLLQNEPTSEEISAGIKELSEKIGEFGTIKSLAKNYSKDPDDILAWEYGKVFGILYTDLEEYKYQKRYNKILERKYHRK